MTVDTTYNAVGLLCKLRGNMGLKCGSMLLFKLDFVERL